jgi:hypothetical protein
MEKMTLKMYAVKHKMSMFNVVKLVKSGKVKSETVEEDGKNVVYIFDDSSPAKHKAKEESIKKEETVKSDGNPKGLLTRVSSLEDEVKSLRNEIETLKRLLL